MRGSGVPLANAATSLLWLAGQGRAGNGSWVCGAVRSSMGGGRIWRQPYARLVPRPASHCRLTLGRQSLATASQATHGTDYRRQPLGLNLAVVLVMLVAKIPSMHKVRIFGINRD